MTEIVHRWPAGGGETGELIRARDWSETPLGPVQSWPMNLRSAVDICLRSNTPIGICWGDHRCLFYNDAWKKFIDENQRLMPGDPVDQVLAASNWAEFKRNIGKVYSTGEAQELKIQALSLDGRDNCCANFSISAVLNEDGSVEGTFIVATEVTDRRQVEADLNDYRLLQDISAQLIEEGSVEALYSKILDAAVAIMQSEYGSLQMLCTERENELGLLAYRGFNQKAADFWERVSVDSASTCSVALRTNERVIVPDIEKCDFLQDTEDQKIYLQTGIHAVQTTPLISRTGELVGMISTHWDEPHEPSERDLHLLDILARQAADLIEKKLSEEVLLRSEERFRAFVMASSDVVYSMSPDWTEMRYLDGRDFIADTPEPSRTWMEKYIAPEDQSRVKQAIREAIRTKSTFELEHRVLRVDGSIGWTFSRAIPILDENGEIIEWFGAASDVTRRKQIKEALLSSKAEIERQKRLYDAILSNTPDLVYVFDLNYRFTYVNEALLQMWGRTLEESIGKNMLEVGYEPWHAEMHEREIDQVIATKQPVRGEVAYPHATLGRRIYDYIFVPVLNDEGKVEAVAGTTRDVTERKQTEVRDQFLDLLNRALQPIDDPEEVMAVTARMLGEYLEVDRCAYAEVQEDQDQLVVTGDYTRGDTPSVVGEWRMSSFGTDAYRLMLENKPLVITDVDVDSRLSPEDITAYEQTVIQAVICVPLHKSNKFNAVLAVHQVEPREWLPEEIELVETVASRCWETIERARLTRDLKAINANLEERVEERTAALLSYQEQLRSLASQLSKAEENERQRLATELHDNLGQLLTMCKMRLDLLRREDLPERAASGAEELTEFMDEAIRYTRELMSDLKPPPSLDQEDLATAMAWVAEKMAKHGLTVHIHDDGRVKPLDEEVSSTLLQATRELLFNVVKHAGVDEADLKLERHGEQVHVIVHDKGRGFTMKGDQPRPTKQGGFGLFSIRERMDLLDGRLSVETNRGEGTTVTLEVPLEVSDQNEAAGTRDMEQHATPAPVLSSNGSSQKVKVLLADDHQMVRTGLRKIIEEQQDLVVVGEASNGSEAVNLVRETTPDVVVMDVNMPVMNGIEATRRIAAQSPGVRIIGLSLHDKENVIQAMRNAGATAYLTKGEVYETLCATIRSEALLIKE